MIHNITATVTTSILTVGIMFFPGASAFAADDSDYGPNKDGWNVTVENITNFSTSYAGGSRVYDSPRIINAKSSSEKPILGNQSTNGLYPANMSFYYGSLDLIDGWMRFVDIVQQGEQAVISCGLSYGSSRFSARYPVGCENPHTTSPRNQPISVKFIPAPEASWSSNWAKNIPPAAPNPYKSNEDGWIVKVRNVSGFDMFYSGGSRVYNSPRGIPTAQWDASTRGKEAHTFSPANLTLYYDSFDLAEGWSRFIKISSVNDYDSNDVGTVICGVTDGTVTSSDSCSASEANTTWHIPVSVTFNALEEGPWRAKHKTETVPPEVVTPKQG